jgi:hypothetical protein
LKSQIVVKDEEDHAEVARKKKVRLLFGSRCSLEWEDLNVGDHEGHHHH